MQLDRHAQVRFASEKNSLNLQCGTELRPVGKETIREELEYIPAKLQIVRYVRMAYECPKCKHTNHPYIQKANTPTSLMNHSLASPSSVANVMYQKYVNSIPLYRQEKDWEQLGISLSRATMANWVIRCSEDYLIPVTEHLRKELLIRDIIHCDETPIQVLKEEGKKPQTKSYMWLYRTGKPYSYDQRLLPYVEDFSKYKQYELTDDLSKLKSYITNCKDKDLVQDIQDYMSYKKIKSYDDLIAYKGEIASGFGSTGGGIQYQLPLPVDILEDLGLLKMIK
ncbi:transposase [Mobilisporobacter senegalensis]|uniref:Transposase n=1 Tax=Mobilisporobacter senegalensis TaxID=1329262 RepID=A0A3N1XRB0_9FIRM|nr:transposase [Mobilisporobacter senegalensis]ROR29204.1 transposase [Mobilisporobacter senegalensis]